MNEDEIVGKAEAFSARLALTVLEDMDRDMERLNVYEAFPLDFDGSTDERDDTVLWIAAPSLQVALNWIHDNRREPYRVNPEPIEIEPDDPAVDAVLWAEPGGHCRWCGRDLDGQEEYAGRCDSDDCPGRNGGV